MSPIMELWRTIIFIFLVIRLSDTEEVKKNLTGTVGGNITLPEPVRELGFLLYRGKNIAMVNDQKLKILGGNYMNRIHWDKTTGLFTLSGLKKNDSGDYSVESHTGTGSSTSYKVSVFDSVPSPAVKTLSVSSESCSLLCSVDQAEETTLLWYKDEEILNQSSSAVSLLLSLNQQDFNSSFRCVAANPAENKTLPVNVTTTCREKKREDPDPNDQRHHLILIVIFVVAGVALVALAACFINCKYLHQKKTISQTQVVDQESDVEYTEVNIKHNQAENFPDSSENGQHSNLLTVYDKLEAHRMSPDPAENT